MDMIENIEMKVRILSLFPGSMEPFLTSSLMGKARAKQLIDVGTVQIRDFAKDRHRSVDDSPYGGGPGMILRADVLFGAWKAARNEFDQKPTTVLLSPQGEKLTAQLARSFSEIQNLILVCGHYEGVDERFIESCVDRQVSIGDYVLTGGELPALVVLDAVARFIPRVVGNAESVEEDSFEKGGLLKYPQYTRPSSFRGMEVPEVLLSGNHAKIDAWRSDQRIKRTEKE